MATPITPSNSLLRSPASPRLTGGEAIAIAAPQRITTGAALLVSGSVRMRPGRFGLPHHAQLVTLVAVDAENGATYVLPAIRPTVAPSGDPTPLGGGFVTTWFNTDLFEGPAGLPRGPGVYHVHAFLHHYVSNGVRVEIVEADS